MDIGYRLMDKIESRRTGAGQVRNLSSRLTKLLK